MIYFSILFNLFVYFIFLLTFFVYFIYFDFILVLSND